MNIYYVDGEFVAEDRAAISVNDLGVIRGYGVFDFMRTYKMRPFFLEDHIRRLETSARLIELAMPRTRREIFGITMETLSRNRGHMTEAAVRIVITGGVSPDGITPPSAARLLVMVTPHHPCPAEWYRDGAAVITTPDERYLPGAKSTHYIPAILALSRAHRQGAMESLYVDRTHRLLEGTTSNVFAFIGERLVTPGASILPGITRQVVMALAGIEFNVEVRDIHRDEIRVMDEVFITSSNKEVVPVVSLDGLTVGDGSPGPRTRRIMELFAACTRAYGEGNQGYEAAGEGQGHGNP
ncbi:aminotransferase class IV [Desulfococcus sp.]|uniref:aminotransferase class IV n=1 Tax=Desulfococcus sp. TaxID=2025834 RepID=UPI0035938458